MDVNLYYFGCVIILLMGLLAIGVRKERGALFSFIGVLIGFVFIAQLNTDAAIQGLGTGAPTGIWPWMYFPILLTILNIGITAFEGTR